MKKAFLMLFVGVLCLIIVGCAPKESKLKNKAENLLDKALDQAEKGLDYTESKLDEEINAAKTEEGMYGYYVFESDYTNSDGSVIHLKATLSLNFDGSAAYTESDG